MALVDRRRAELQRASRLTHGAVVAGDTDVTAPKSTTPASFAHSPEDSPFFMKSSWSCLESRQTLPPHSPLQLPFLHLSFPVAFLIGLPALLNLTHWLACPNKSARISGLLPGISCSTEFATMGGLIVSTCPP